MTWSTVKLLHWYCHAARLLASESAFEPVSATVLTLLPLTQVPNAAAESALTLLSALWVSLASVSVSFQAPSAFLIHDR